ncbi:trans-sialidase, putative, partial [Trypanosoma cruzi marinkellei]
MHSRVAAVKAPRTHNRRRVTGSSGRRREGRESEWQRPNMSRRLFCSAVLLLLVVMMCCGAGGTTVSEGRKSSSGSQSKEYFDWRDVKNEGESVSFLYVPSLVDVNGKVFAVAQAQCKKNAECLFTGIASELLTLDGGTPKELETTRVKTQVLEKFPSDGAQCPSEAAISDGLQSKKEAYVSRPTTVVKGNDIYMLAGKYSSEDSEKSGAVDWGLLLVKGNVSKDESNERIYWNDTYGLLWNSKDEHQDTLKGVIGGGGSGVKMNGDTLVFPVEGTKKGTKDGREEDGKTVSLILYSTDNTNWKLSKGMSDGGCSDPSIAEWKDGKLMMMTACDDGRRRVYEIGDKEKSWTEALGTLSRVWGNSHRRHERGVRSGFTTATLGSDDNRRNVMLVTLPVYFKENKTTNATGVLHLWLTDNT